MEAIPSELVRIKEQLEQGAPVPDETVRSLLGWFKAHRRGFYVVKDIRKALDSLGLDTVPDFDSVFIDATVQFTMNDNQSSQSTKSNQDTSKASSTSETAEEATANEQNNRTEETATDPATTLGKLPSANRLPVIISPDDTLTQAMTLMILNGYSQLPVVSGKATIRGVVSWKSIGEQLALGNRPEYVRECLGEPVIREQDTSLFSAVVDIIQHQCILVRDKRKQLTGIVTTTDLSDHFRQLALPFLQIGEIENFLRELIKPHFSPDELSRVSVREGEKKTVSSVYDLQFGDYLYLLRMPGNFARLGLSIDPDAFLTQLDKVRQIRNDIMHFQPDDLEEEALAVLSHTRAFLHRLRKNESRSQNKGEKHEH